MGKQFTVLILFQILFLSHSSAESLGVAQLHGENLPGSCFKWVSEESSVELASIPVTPLTLKANFTGEVTDPQCVVYINGAKVHKKDDPERTVNSDVIVAGTDSLVTVTITDEKNETKDFTFTVEFKDYGKSFEKISPKAKEPWAYGVITPSLGLSYDMYNQTSVDAYKAFNLAYSFDYRVTNILFNREVIKLRAALIGIPPLTSQSVFEVPGIKVSSMESEFLYGHTLAKKWKRTSLSLLGGVFYGDMTVGQNVFGYKSLLMPEAVAELMYGLKPGNMFMGDFKLGFYISNPAYFLVELRPAWIHRINDFWVLDVKLDFRYLTFGTVFGTLNAITVTPTVGVDLTF